MMTKKDYQIIADSIKETRESGVTSGYNVKRVTDKFVEIMNEKMSAKFPNYNSDKFFKVIYEK